MTLSRVFRLVFPVVGVFLLGFGGVLLGGCDSTGSKRASLYERLTGTGTWTVEELREKGEINYTNQLNERYPEGVKITFEGGDEGRTYKIMSPSGNSPEVIVEGAIDLPGDDVLRMASGFGQQGPVTWRYRFQTTSRAIFEIQRGSRAFLSALISVGRSGPDLKMELAPDDE